MHKTRKRRGRPRGVKNGQGTGSSYTPTKMRDAYREIARLKAAGKKDVDIAAKMGVSAQMVGYVTRSGLVRHQIEQLHEERDAISVDIASEIAKATPVALATVLEVMLDGSKEELRLKAAESLLDRNPESSKHSTRRIEGRGGFSKEEIEDLKANAVKMARDAGIMPDIEDAVFVLDDDDEEEEEE